MYPLYPLIIDVPSLLSDCRCTLSTSLLIAIVPICILIIGVPVDLPGEDARSDGHQDAGS